METFLLLALLGSLMFLGYGFLQYFFIRILKIQVNDSIKKLPHINQLDDILPEIKERFPNSMPKYVETFNFKWGNQKVVVPLERR